MWSLWAGRKDQAQISQWTSTCPFFSDYRGELNFIWTFWTIYNSVFGDIRWLKNSTHWVIITRTKKKERMQLLHHRLKVFPITKPMSQSAIKYDSWQDTVRCEKANLHANPWKKLTKWNWFSDQTWIAVTTGAYYSTTTNGSSNPLTVYSTASNSLLSSNYHHHHHQPQSTVVDSIDTSNNCSSTMVLGVNGSNGVSGLGKGSNSRYCH